MFQIFVRRTLFCVLSPVPLSDSTALVGFQLKILQSMLPCVISLRFCTSSLISKYVGDNVKVRHWFTAQIEHLSNFRVRDHSFCPPGANDGNVQRQQSVFLCFFFFLLQIKFGPCRETERDACEGWWGLRWGVGGGVPLGEKEEDEPACV